MRLCDLSSGTGQLNHAMSKLKQHWTDAKPFWNDDVSRKFQEQHLQPIPAELQSLLLAVESYSQVIAQAERDCSDRDQE